MLRMGGQPVSYAVKKDGSGWRSVNSPDDLFEYELFSEAQPDPIVQNKILQQISEIESSITPRRMREASLTTAGKAWLKAQDDAIAALRAQL